MVYVDQLGVHACLNATTNHPCVCAWIHVQQLQARVGLSLMVACSTSKHVVCATTCHPCPFSSWSSTCLSVRLAWCSVRTPLHGSRPCSHGACLVVACSDSHGRRADHGAAAAAARQAYAHAAAAHDSTRAPATAPAVPLPEGPFHSSAVSPRWLHSHSDSHHEQQQQQRRHSAAAEPEQQPALQCGGVSGWVPGVWGQEHGRPQQRHQHHTRLGEWGDARVCATDVWGAGGAGADQQRSGSALVEVLPHNGFLDLCSFKRQCMNQQQQHTVCFGCHRMQATQQQQQPSLVQCVLPTVRPFPLVHLRSKRFLACALNICC